MQEALTADEASKILGIGVHQLNLKELRKQKGLTQKQVAEKCGMSYQSYAHYESGRRMLPIDTFLKLKSVFEISLDDLAVIILNQINHSN